MGNLKPFAPDDVDETLTRIVTHRGFTYLLFPYIDGTGSLPRFNSVSCLIDGPSASVRDFSALSALLLQSAAKAKWYLSFNTPWLIDQSEADVAGQRPRRA